MMSRTNSSTSSPQALVVGGKPYVLIEQAEYQRLLAKAGEGPPLPQPDLEGRYPAQETLDALIAQGIVRQRKALGLSQGELARKAGVREETLKQIEQGDYSPSTAVVDRIDRALREAEREQATLIDKDRQAGRKRRKARAR